jgi:hypothetical protein
MKIFNTKKMSEFVKKEVYISKIDKISDFDDQFLMKFIVEIISGRQSDYTLDYILSVLIDRLEKNLDERKKHGYIAELLSCCILRDYGFSQEYCCENLEENSMKKGFDGLYSKEEKLYILESKSSYSFRIHGDKHATTVRKAYADINNRFTYGTTNNPWANAVYHAKAAKTKDTLVKQLTELSSKWQKGVFGKNEDNNIILASTIFSETIFENALNYEYIQEIIDNHNVKDEIVLLNELKTSNIILDYLKGKQNG